MLRRNLNSSGILLFDYQKTLQQKNCRLGKEKYMKMNYDIVKAKKILKDGGYTCVLVKGENIYTSTDRGVKPLLNWLDEKNDIKDCSAADKVIGKAAAFIYVLLGVKAVYAFVISNPALEVFKKYGVDVSFEEKVDMIRNRTNTGYCPMEQATMSVFAPKEALISIKKTLKKLEAEKL